MLSPGSSPGRALDPAKGIALGTLDFVWAGEGAYRAAGTTTVGPLSSPNKNRDRKGYAFAGVWGSAPAFILTPTQDETYAELP